MTHILSAFADREGAESAAARLLEAGFDAEHTRVVERPPPVNQGSIMVDELATGGMVHSLTSLLDGLFGTVKSERVADDYDQAESRVAVVVDVDDEAQALRAREMLEEAGASAVSVVPPTGDMPSSSSSRPA